MVMTSPDYDVVVVGGGVVGMLSVAMLADAGLTAALITPDIDTRAPTGDIGAPCYAITPGSRAVLDAVGAWGRIDLSRVGRFDGMEVWDAGSSGRIQFDPPVTHVGPMGWIVEQQNLIAALAATLEARASVSIHRQTMAELLHAPSPGVRLQDGSTVRACLVIGADGAGSEVREAAGIEVERIPYDQIAIVCNVVCDKPHAGVARQRFLASGPLAFLPLAEPNCCSIVWSCSADLANSITADNDDILCRRLENALDHRLGEIRQVGPRASFRLERLRTTRYVLDNCVLVGDAAHVVHPLAGQGLNLGIMDVAALVECLGSRGTSLNWPRPAALRHYARWRASETLAMSLVTDGLNRLFQGDERTLGTIRGVGMRMTDRMTAVKHWLIERAMGIDGDIPKIANPLRIGDV